MQATSEVDSPDEEEESAHDDIHLIRLLKTVAEAASASSDRETAASAIWDMSGSSLVAHRLFQLGFSTLAEAFISVANPTAHDCRMQEVQLVMLTLVLTRCDSVCILFSPWFSECPDYSGHTVELHPRGP